MLPNLDGCVITVVVEWKSIGLKSSQLVTDRDDGIHIRRPINPAR